MRRNLLSKEIIESDKFMNLSQMAKLYYVISCLYVDDEGFYRDPRDLINRLGCEDTVIQELLQQGFINLYKDGIIVDFNPLNNATHRFRNCTPNELLFDK